ncbi:MAG: CHAP domain-containing protein [Agathobacter sp.]|nr:CHAP domain-containing protein [Agathobacter sp.]
MKKKIYCFILALFIACTSLSNAPLLYNAALNTIPKADAQLEATIKDYMDYRFKILTTGTTDTDSSITVVGIVNDELKHATTLKVAGISLTNYQFTITDFDEPDTIFTATITEQFRYLKNGISYAGTNEHLLTLSYDNNNQLVVISDNYIENVSNFISCSYVSLEEEAIETYAMQVNPLIILIANSQVGYMEKASNSNLDSFTANAGSANYTKYGAWYGNNGQDWCATFVSWCANQAGISETMVPKYESCDAGMSTFKSWGRFYSSEAYNGNYTPKVGDIFFMGPNQWDSSHTGIVVGVSGSTITVVDGNCDNQVSKHPLSLSDTALLGFGNPVYASCSHSAQYVHDSSSHWMQCTGVCGVKLSYPASHTYSSGKCKICGRIQAISA